jgi:hypothetical protein
MQQRARNGQETVNKRFKDWGLLRKVYRHEISSHGLAFRAIAVITQLAINGGRRYLSVATKIRRMKIMMTMTMIFEEFTMALYPLMPSICTLVSSLAVRYL